MAYSLDKIDLKIIHLLQKDAKMKIKEIADKLGMTNTPIFDRIKKLEKAGVITGYSATIDKEKVTVVNKCEKFIEDKPEEADSAVVGLITGDSPIRKLESEDKLTIDGKVKIIDTVVRDFVNEKTIIIKYVGSDSTDTYSIDITIKQIPGFQKVERP